MNSEAPFAKSVVSTQEGRCWWLFTACVLVSLTNEVSTAVTNLSLGPMRRDLGASSAVMQIALTLGKLMLGAFMLAGGVAGDVYGRRRVLVLGALGMVGASLFAAVAQTGGMLLVARALDGLASAAIAPMALALIASAFSQAEQARVIGLYLGLSGLGAALGPLGAGLVSASAGLACRISCACGGGRPRWLGRVRVCLRRRRKNRGPAAGWHRHAHLCCRSARTGVRDHSDQPRRLAASVGVGILAVGIGALLAFVWWERRAGDPLLDVTLFRNRTVSLAVTTGLLAALVMGGALLPLLYFLQTVQKVSQISAILQLMPMMAAAAAFAPVAGGLTAKIGPRKVIAGGWCLWRPGAAY
jgi:MFS family permease